MADEPELGLVSVIIPVSKRKGRGIAIRHGESFKQCRDLGHSDALFSEPTLPAR